MADVPEGAKAVSKSGHDISPLSREEVDRIAETLDPETRDVALHEGTERAFTGASGSHTAERHLHRARHGPMKERRDNTTSLEERVVFMQGSTGIIMRRGRMCRRLVAFLSSDRRTSSNLGPAGRRSQLQSTKIM